jgi:CelD/BcsL family acetyltransferase involved in cellulose biosynthesis
MAFQSVRSELVTHATPLTAFRIATRPVDAGHPTLPRWSDASHQNAQDLALAVYKSLTAVETEWRRFEAVAECTPFQTYEWLAAWQRHVGLCEGVVPAIAVGRFADGKTAIIAPLAVTPRHSFRRLCWFGQDLCDYNAPLFARDFSQRVTPDGFLAFWRELRAQLQSDPDLRHDWIDFEKMPETVGAQINPFTQLAVMPNANSAHITQLGDDWETFYRDVRSSATRRRDRAKRKRIAEFGEIRFITAAAPDEIGRTLETVWNQKKRIFVRKGISDIFSRPGYRDFFLDFASNPQTRHLAHVSRLEVGSNCAAANFAITFGDCYYHVLSSYCDDELTRHGPGTLHLRELLAHAIRLGLRRFDFTIGDERYKLEWSDLRLKLFDYSAAATWRGWPLHFASIARRRLKRLIKQSPLAWSLVCRIRSLIGPF